MDLPHFLRDINLNDKPPRAPRVLLYIPPHGRPVHCPDVEAAKTAAENYAAERPGVTVGVYQLVGYAHRPIEKPIFQDTEQALAMLLVAEPDSGIVNTRADDGIEAERPDLNPQQRETLERVRAIMREDADAPEPSDE